VFINGTSSITEGRKDVTNDACRRRRSASTSDANFQSVNGIVIESSQITIRDAFGDISILVRSCHAIFRCFGHGMCDSHFSSGSAQF
jgi:hypothetical protein